MIRVLQFCFFQFLCILSHGQGINHILDVTSQETIEVVGGVTDTVVGNTALWEVVGTNLRTTVAGRDEALTAAGDIVNILLMLTVVDEGIEAAQGTLLVLWLVTGLGTLDEDFLYLACVRVLPRIAEANSRLHLVHVLTTGT